MLLSDEGLAFIRVLSGNARYLGHAINFCNFSGKKILLVYK